MLDLTQFQTLEAIELAKKFDKKRKKIIGLIVGALIIVAGILNIVFYKVGMSGVDYAFLNFLNCVGIVAITASTNLRFGADWVRENVESVLHEQRLIDEAIEGGE